MAEEVTHIFGLLTEEEYKETMATIIIMGVMGALMGLLSKIVTKAVQKYVT